MITVTVSGETPAELAGALAVLLRSLSASAPAVAAAPLAVVAPANEYAAPPQCPAHGSPLKRSKRGGGWYCPRQDDAGGWCKASAA